MISMKEIIHCGAELESFSEEKQAELKDLLERVNIVRTKWAKPMTVTSGVRTWADHLRIYAEKGITDLDKIPKKSKHLETVDAAAVDIADEGLLITEWLKANPEILEEAGLWCEDGNKNWVHFQNKPFGSYKEGGTRWFKI